MVRHLDAQFAGQPDVTVVPAGFLTYEHVGAPVEFVYSRNALHQLPDFWKGIALQRITAYLAPGAIFRVARPGLRLRTRRSRRVHPGVDGRRRGRPGTGAGRRTNSPSTCASSSAPTAGCSSRCSSGSASRSSTSTTCAGLTAPTPAGTLDRREPTGRRDLAVPPPAPRQSGRLVSVGRRGVRRRRAAQCADPAVGRLLGLPLVPRDGARVLRGRRGRRRG